MGDEFVKKSVCDSISQKMLDGLNELNGRLYRDNGTKSVQTQIRELTIAMTNLTNALADHIKAERTALSRRLNIVIKSMVIATMVYGLLLFIIRTAPVAIKVVENG